MPHQWSCQLLRAGSFRLDGGSMFGVVPKVLWSKLVQPDELNRIPLQTNCLLLDDGSRKVLIEVGFGDKWSDKERGFYDIQRRCIVDALREINVEPQQINHVIVTHLHFDHAAGLTTLNNKREPVPTFPNASIFVQKTELDDALANKSTMNRTYLRSHLDPIAARLNLIDATSQGKSDVEILPGITVFPMPGHTWGQQAVCFDDNHGTICFAGDVLPTVNHVGLPFSLAYDMLPHQSMLSKRMLYERAIANDWRLALDHEPGHAIVCVQRDKERDDKFSLIDA